jgi:hypothetical protein
MGGLLTAANGCSMGHIPTQALGEFRFVIRVYLSVVAPTRNSDIGEPGVYQMLAFIRVGVDQNSVSRLSLAAVTGHGIRRRIAARGRSQYGLRYRRIFRGS